MPPQAPTIPDRFPPQTAEERALLLEFARTSALVYGPWRQFKALCKQAEGGGDEELLALLIARLDAAPLALPAVGEQDTRLRQPVAIAASGGFAYVAAGPRLLTLDLSEPAAPRSRGSVLVSRSRAVSVAGDHVCTLAHTGPGLRVVDVSDPDRPCQVAALDAQNATALAVAGPYLYLLVENPDGGAGALQVVDLQDPAQPRPLRVLPLGAAHLLALAGGRAYVAEHGAARASQATRHGGISAFLRALDAGQLGEVLRALGAPGAPGAPPAGEARKGVLRVLDLADPTDPRVVGTLEVGEAQGLAATGAHVYVLGEPGRGGKAPLQVVDASDPVRPRVVGTLRIDLGGGGSEHGLIAAEGRLYVTGGLPGLRIVDVANPTQPVELGAANVWSTEAGVVVGDFAYLCANHQGFYVFDLADPARPTRLGTPPEPATVGYMKRRARRLLRRVAEQEPGRFAPLAQRVLLEAGQGRAEVDVDSQWVSMDLLYAGGDRFEQSRHGRGAYLPRRNRVSLRTREERAPDLWDQRPELLYALAAGAGLPWQTREMAMKALRARREPLPPLDEASLGACLASRSALLQAVAARQVTERILGGQVIEPALAAGAFFHASGRGRRLLAAVLERRGSISAWDRQFTQHLLLPVAEAASAGRVTPRVVASAALFTGRLAVALPERSSLAVAVATSLLASGRADLVGLAQPLIRESAVDPLLTLVPMLELLTEPRRGRALELLGNALRGVTVELETARQLVQHESAWRREAGWQLLAAIPAPPTVAASLWQELLALERATPALRTGIESAAALTLLRHVRGDQVVLPPFLLPLLTPAALAVLAGSLPPDALLQLAASAPDDQWLAMRSVLLPGLAAPGRALAFWQALWAAIGSDATGIVKRRLVDDPEIAATFLGLAEPAFLENPDPGLEALLRRWADRHTDLFDPDGPALLAAATSQLPAVRDWGLARVRALGMELPFALRLLESELPQPVALGREHCEAIPAGDPRALEIALSLCDSPAASVRAYGRDFVRARWEWLSPAQVVQALSEHGDPLTQEFLARILLRSPPLAAEATGFDSHVLRARDRGRRAKELVKSRVAREATPDVAALLELARGRNRRDREWALEQLARLALAGHEIEGLTLDGAAGV